MAATILSVFLHGRFYFYAYRDFMDVRVKAHNTDRVRLLGLCQYGDMFGVPYEIFWLCESSLNKYRMNLFQKWVSLQAEDIGSATNFLIFLLDSYASDCIYNAT